jgi:CheY-like chemotaxis protein
MDARRRVLVIEDDQGCSELIAEVVRDMDLDVVVHDRASEALQVIREQQPAVVVLDIMLPDGDGLSVLQAVRNDPASRDVPVLLCTAALFEITGLEKPVSDPHTQLILKPFHIDAFIAILTKLLADR